MEQLAWRIDPKTMLDETELARVSKATALLNIKSGIAIDSYKMSEDGPHLSSIFIVSDEYLAEVILEGPVFNFDFSPVTMLVNIRVKQGSVGIPMTEEAQEDGESTPSEASAQGTPTKKVENVSISVAHDTQLYSEFNYFGDGGDEWLRFILENYALKTMRRNQS